MKHQQLELLPQYEKERIKKESLGNFLYELAFLRRNQSFCASSCGDHFLGALGDHPKAAPNLKIRSVWNFCFH